MSRRDKSHNLAVGVITRGSRRKRDTETFGGNDRFRGPGWPEGDVSVFGREAQEETFCSTQLVAETCVKTQKAGADCLGLWSLTRGYRFVRYRVFSGETPRSVEHCRTSQARQEGFALPWRAEESYFGSVSGTESSLRCGRGWLDTRTWSPVS